MSPDWYDSADCCANYSMSFLARLLMMTGSRSVLTLGQPKVSTSLCSQADDSERHVFVHYFERYVLSQLVLS